MRCVGIDFIIAKMACRKEAIALESLKKRKSKTHTRSNHIDFANFQFDLKKKRKSFLFALDEFGNFELNGTILWSVFTRFPVI